MTDFLPVTCETCGRTMPRGIADNPETHSCAKTLAYEFGFIADGGNVWTHIFGLPFKSAYMAHHAGEKTYLDTLEIVRRSPGGEWETVPNNEIGDAP